MMEKTTRHPKTESPNWFRLPQESRLLIKNLVSLDILIKLENKSSLKIVPQCSNIRSRLGVVYSPVIKPEMAEEKMEG